MVKIQSRAIIAPGKYVQGPGELKQIGVHAASLGNKFLVLASKGGMKRCKAQIEEGFSASGSQLIFEEFNQECSKVEIDRLVDICQKEKCEAVIGIGGGKLLDTAKAVAHFHGNAPVIIIPTIASTDAPCSALSVIYTEEGVFQEYLILPKNPNLVIVDSSIIASAPVRLLVAGMGDALATYFEARACRASGAGNMTGLRPPLSAMALAELCYKTLITDGLKAKMAVEHKSVTIAVENIIEANTLLSGIGFESGGLAAAHAIHNGFTVLPQCHHLYHGEKVAFGTLTQMVLENLPNEEINEVLEFCSSIGLPISLSEMGIDEIKPEEIKAVAEAACAEGETIFNMPCPVTVEDLYGAILTADGLGRNFLRK
jgi:glycerol dehydrogenase